MAASILSIGRFVPKHACAEDAGIPLTWQRYVEEEDAVVTVSLTGGIFDISISPSINSFDHHLGKRITAGVYFEISAKYAEKVAGEIVQRATVTGCKESSNGAGLLVARYPSMPMTFDRVCHGFQAVLIPGEHDFDHPLAS
jgi:hypothetical protein